MVPIINHSLVTHVEIKTAAFSSNKSILGIWTSFVADIETFSQDLGPYSKKIKWPFLILFVVFKQIIYSKKL